MTTTLPLQIPLKISKGSNIPCWKVKIELTRDICPILLAHVPYRSTYNRQSTNYLSRFYDVSKGQKTWGFQLRRKV